MKTQRRRRREAKTDYKSRFGLLKSEKPRLVIRKTNRYILAQVVISVIAQDKIIARASSKELLEKGWPKDRIWSLKSLVASYLTGKLLASKLKGKIKEAILDIGMNRNIGGSRIYALAKGALDGGFKIVHKAESLPSEERLKSNEKTKDLLKLKEKI